jgi:IS605 OrfB family transposase
VIHTHPDFLNICTASCWVGALDVVRCLQVNPLPLTRRKRDLLADLVVENTRNHNLTAQIQRGLAPSASELDLHRASYAAVKAQTRLNADVVIEARKSVANRPAPTGHYRDVPVLLNERAFTLVATGRGNLAVLLRLGRNLHIVEPIRNDGALAYLQRHLQQGWLAKAIQVHGDGKLAVILRKSCRVAAPDDLPRVVGVDLGFHDLAAIVVKDKATGQILAEQLVGKGFRARKRAAWHREDLLRHLMRKGNRKDRVRRSMRRARGASMRLTQDAVKQAARQIAGLAARHQAEIRVEALTIHAGAFRGTAGCHKANRAKNAVPHGAFIDALRSTAALRGIPVTEVRAAYTSTTCSRCSAPALQVAGRQVACSSCGVVLHRDLNAASNIAGGRIAKKQRQSLCKKRWRSGAGQGAHVVGRNRVRVDPFRMLLPASGMHMKDRRNRERQRTPVYQPRKI